MKETVLRSLDQIDEASSALCGLSDAIWEHPETAFLEKTSADLLCKALVSLENDIVGESSSSNESPIVGVTLPKLAQRMKVESANRAPQIPATCIAPFAVIAP